MPETVQSTERAAGLPYERSAGSTIALTGATGFLASHLLLRLLPHDVRVVALVRKPPQRALSSLACALRSAGAPEETVQRIPHQVRAVQVGLDRPQLGLSEAEFRTISDSVDAVWHCAALTKLHGAAEELHRTNVEGTRHILALATAGGRKPPLFHVSTAFVAGAQLEGVVPERQLDSAHGFLTPYEESKHRAENLVHRWARDNGRSATIFRPSVLLSERSALPRAPQHTYAVLAAKLALFLRHSLRDLPSPAPPPSSDRTSQPASFADQLVVRLVGAPDSGINLLQVEDAALAMLRLAENAPRGPGARVHHIVHPVETPVEQINNALQRSTPRLRLELVTNRPDPTGLERAIDRFGAEATAYLGLRRRYERSSLRDLECRHLLNPPAPIDSSYLDAALSPPPSAH
ncbi:male sterility protein [Streptomyces brevispora]|uniref:Male sterility protein n=1 Tax=Streptomyces brevispora TaxID=887462 RepID=A0A561UX08_9ACTN|nr:SDR family oxidoreductase [Streptomyces brevispora]TWG03881.1 male sterility protein [Streptomyces brevispora]